MNNNTEKEIWKDIKGYEGVYQISDKGNVKSLERIVKSKSNLTRKQHEKILKQGTTGDGYPIVVLRKDNKSKTLSVHRLMVTNFKALESDDFEVNHIDGVKCNNLLSNLEVVDRSENMKHASRKGLRFMKLTETDVTEIRNTYQEGKITQKQIATKYGVSKQTISDICRERTWK